MPKVILPLQRQFKLFGLIPIPGIWINSPIEVEDDTKHPQWDECQRLGIGPSAPGLGDSKVAEAPPSIS